jgi:hypothetical protein
MFNKQEQLNNLSSFAASNMNMYSFLFGNNLWFMNLN